MCANLLLCTSLMLKAESAIGAIETDMKRNLKFKEPLSVQQVLDCVKTKDSDGCNGGTPMDALNYFKTRPIASAREYPRTGKVGVCKKVERASKTFSGGFTAMIPPCTTGSCAQQWKREAELVTSSPSMGVPLIAYVDASNWQNCQ